MNYHEYSDSVQRHVIRLPRDHFFYHMIIKNFPIFYRHIQLFFVEFFLPKRVVEGYEFYSDLLQTILQF